MMLDTAIRVLVVASLVPGLVDSFQVGSLSTSGTRSYNKISLSSSVQSEPEAIGAKLEESLDKCRSELIKTGKVQIGTSPTTGRLGLIATSNIKKNEVFLAMPYEGGIQFSASIARDTVFKDVLVDTYEGWTGDAGLIALMILNEVARSASSGGIDLPKRQTGIQEFITRWVESLPSPSEMKVAHPLMWPEEDQEIMQSSSTNKIYQTLDDIEEDVTWLVENVFSKDRKAFPELAKWNGSTIPCFSLEGYTWAMALVKSRSVYVDGKVRLLPFMDFCNHEDDGEEIMGGTMGTFGTIKGAQIIAQRSYKAGEEVFCSYGPKSAADYLLEHGFCPKQSMKTAVSELAFELNPEDRFYDDKMDVLEFETYGQAPMDPVQKFDVVSAPGRDDEPDPALIQFVRLCQLGESDAFMLESIFRKDVWGFMAMPVSERNELKVINEISEACQKALTDLGECKEGGPEICSQIRESEIKALTRTLEYFQREKEALDLKEYYQERRLKDLGLDSDWAPEDDMGGEDLSFGQTRVPGGADYDW